MHPKKVAGIVVSSTEISVVVLSSDTDQCFTIVSANTLKTGSLDRPLAYRQVFENLKDCLKIAKVDSICIKASAVSNGGMGLAHLHSAELRGVAIAAAATVCSSVHCQNKSTTSKKGDQNVAEMLKDNDWWESKGLAELKKGNREAAYMAITSPH